MSDSAAIYAWHIVISGFRQHEGQPTGMVKLWRRLHRRYAQGGVCVELRAWNDDWRDLAELIWRVQPAEAPNVVKVYAYSWGAGYGAIELSRHLLRRGVGVSWMVLSDPVYRSRWLLTRWLALAPCQSIVVPRNVQSVRWFRQQLCLPRGHALRAEQRERTQIAPPVWVDVAHPYMDDLPLFHRECERIAAL